MSTDSNHEQAILEFKAKVQECTDTACCSRKYVLVTKLVQWLKSKISPTSQATYASRLLDAAYLRYRKGPALPITKEQLSDGEDRCLLVFCILLELGRGELIDQFWRKERVDKRLPIDLDTLHTIFQNMNIQDPYKIAKRFDDLQWRFCPARFELEMGREYPRNRILPIRKKQEINEKGGTAQLWQIEVLEEFVGVKLREAMKDSVYDPQEIDALGRRYEFALKTFGEGNRDYFKNEVGAFQSLREKKGIVQYLGEYSHCEYIPKEIQTQYQNPQTAPKGTGQHVERATYNIMLEYGESDLEEYFADTNPPYLQPEVEAFWGGLFAVADAVQCIHNLKMETGGKPEEFHGWHADIKPDNILVVQKKFKLADPGFVKFVKKTSQAPKEVLSGGTETYGAPERHRGRADLSCGFSQTIDTWSLGCVFSIAATWVVLGYQGIQQYNVIRQKAIQRIISDQQKLPATQRPTIPLSERDYFHDGVNVLSDVLKWHLVLRDALRRTDTVTSQVLDLIDNKLLLADPSLRLTAAQVCKELKDILSTAQEKPRIRAPTTIEEYLREVDDNAPAKPRDSGSVSSLEKTGKSQTIKEARKSKLNRLPIMKTTHRSQVLRSILTRSGPWQIKEEQTHNLLSGVSFTRKMNSRESADQSNGLSQSPDHYTSPPVTPQEVHSPKRDSSRHFSDPTVPLTQNRPRMPRRPRTSIKEGYQSVFQAREEIEQRDKSTSIFGTKPKDEVLARYFGNRDIKFLVDNSYSMTPYWFEATYLLETLILKARGQDKNGMDLTFTSGPTKVENREGRTNKLSKDPFVSAMKDHNARPRKDIHANMRQALGDILDKYVNDARKQKRMGSHVKSLTLLVLTDGKWEGMIDKWGVKDLIITFVHNLREVVGDLKLRPVSIEFIQFGDDEDASYRLWVLDNHLKYDGVPDIIDTEHSSGNVYKMLLGSFVEEYDHKEEEEEDELPPGSPIPQSDLYDSGDVFGGLSRSGTFRPSSTADQHGRYTPPSRHNTMRQNTASSPTIQRQFTTSMSRPGDGELYRP